VIVKFLNPTAVRYVGMSTQTTNLKDGLKPVLSPTGDAPAQNERGASAGLGGQAPRVASLSLSPIQEVLIGIDRELLNAYNMLKGVMAYVGDDDYAWLERVRKKIIEAQLAINGALDLLPHKVTIKIKNIEDAPYEVVEA